MHQRVMSLMLRPLITSPSMMNPFLEAYLTPSVSAVKFGIKATLAMFVALYLALWLDLDRPYWALISAAFLQIRPMSGMVIEKGLCQLGGTAIGAFVAIVIMALFAQARVPAIVSLTLWIMCCSYACSLLRNNYSFGCVMAAVTAMLVVVISGSNPGSVFDVAVARLSELGLGAICATLISSLLWPTRVSDHLAQQADKVVNEAFLQAAQRLEGSDVEADLQASLTGSLQPLTMLETDSQAARFEDPDGNARVRATHVLTRHTLRLLATLQAMNRILRDRDTEIDTDLRELIVATGEGFRESEQVTGVAPAKQHIQTLRHRAHQLSLADRAPLQQRIGHGLTEILNHALVMLDAREAISAPSGRKLKSAPLSWHRDHLAAGLNGMRSGVVFALLALFWLATGWQNGQVAMLLGTMFSTFFASRENPVAMAMMFFKGMLAAIPSAFLFGHVLLSQADGFIPLVLALAPPLFLGLMGAGNMKIMGYCLPFVVFNILLTMPGNGMDFSFDSFANRALGVIIGLSAVVMSFRLIPGLGATIRRRRLVAAIGRDLDELPRLPVSEAESRFVGRMADRILAMARHDDTLPEQRRHLFGIGLVGLDMGHSLLRLRRRLPQDESVSRALTHFRQVLAEAYVASAYGRDITGQLGVAAQQLLSAVEATALMPPARLALFEGLLQRLELTLRQQSERIAEHIM